MNDTWLTEKDKTFMILIFKRVNKLPGAAYTVPTSNLKEPTTVPDRSKLRECNTYKIHSQRTYPKS